MLGLIGGGREAAAGSQKVVHAEMVNPLQFIQEVRQEVSKVTWPSWKQVWLTTLMVLIMVTVASLFFTTADLAIAYVVERFILGATR